MKKRSIFFLRYPCRDIVFVPRTGAVFSGTAVLSAGEIGEAVDGHCGKGEKGKGG